MNTGNILNYFYMATLFQEIYETLNQWSPSYHEGNECELNSIKVWVFFEKKHLCRHDKNNYYFCKSNIN